MRVESHRLHSARQIASPHQDARPTGEISLIVLHGISLPAGHFGGNEIIALFTGALDTSAPAFADLEGMAVSSHLLIRRDGELIQFVPFDRRAWHAGQSSFHGRARCNDFSIGIELEGTDTLPYENAQYAALGAVCGALEHCYGITDIAGHCDIAPARKTDPGPSFDWPRLRRLLAASR